jgi:hypothetical protein
MTCCNACMMCMYACHCSSVGRLDCGWGVCSCALVKDVACNHQPSAACQHLKLPTKLNLLHPPCGKKTCCALYAYRTPFKARNRSVCTCMQSTSVLSNKEVCWVGAEDCKHTPPCLQLNGHQKHTKALLDRPPLPGPLQPPALVTDALTPHSPRRLACTCRATELNRHCFS